MDPWYSLGSADMLEVASMGLHVAQMTGVEQMQSLFSCSHGNSSRYPGFGRLRNLEKGCNADLVILQAVDPVEALRLKANRLFVIRRGKHHRAAQNQLAIRIWICQDVLKSENYSVYNKLQILNP